MNRVRLHSPIVNRLDQIFQAFASHDFPGMAPRLSPAFPPVNLWETEEGYVLETELPGYSAEQLSINVLGSQLTIAGERAPVHAGEGAQVIRKERMAGKFERSIDLPTAVDPDKIDASLVAGVLTIKLAKPETVKPTKVNVKAL